MNSKFTSDTISGMSHYKAKISWKSSSEEEFTRNKYSRGHEWEFDEGLKIPASSSPFVVRVPFSVEAAVDPEEAVVAAASSCHMLTFLYLAKKSGFIVSSYTDSAEGEMSINEEGRPFLSKITLDPQIEWVGDKLPTSQEIAELHHNAHLECPIANSIKGDVIIKT